MDKDDMDAMDDLRDSLQRETDKLEVVIKELATYKAAIPQKREGTLTRERMAFAEGWNSCVDEMKKNIGGT